jgi:hypothetical protein
LSRIRGGSIRSMAMSGTGWRTAGTTITTAPRLTARHGPLEIAIAAFFAAAHGAATLRAFARPFAAVTSRRSGTSIRGSVLLGRLALKLRQHSAMTRSFFKRTAALATLCCATSVFAQGEFSPSYTADEACHNLGVVYVTGTEEEPSYQKHIPQWVAACNRATGPACLATRSVIGDDLKKPVPEGLTCR